MSYPRSVLPVSAHARPLCAAVAITLLALASCNAATAPNGTSSPPSDAGDAATDAGAADLGPPSPAAVAACADSARALCARAVSCVANYTQLIFGTIERCERQTAAACEMRYRGPGAAAEPVSCAEAAATIPCEELAAWEAILRADPGMHRCPVTPGRFADGAGCRADGDCQSGNCDHLTDCRKLPCVPGCGICKPLAAAGEPCNGSHSCPSDMICSPTLNDASPRCLRAPHLGEPCNGACVGHGFSTYCANVCSSLVADGAGVEGAPCAQGMYCAAARGLKCSATSVCTKFQVIGVGAACERHSSPLGTGTEPFCDANSRCVAGTCTAWPHFGEPCDPTANPASMETTPCAWGLRCDPTTSKCVVNDYPAVICASP